jgi:hypothetical protein
MPNWESEEGTVDVEKYNDSLKREPERDRLRAERTSSFLRLAVVKEEVWRIHTGVAVQPAERSPLKFSDHGRTNQH